MGDQVPLTSVAIAGVWATGNMVSAAHADDHIELLVTMLDENRVCMIKLRSGEASELGHALIAMAAELETPRPRPPKALELNRVKPPRVPLYRGTEGP